MGCCLLAIDGMRPAGVPASLGVRMRAAANRISVEWEGASGHRRRRLRAASADTDSLPARVLGGRWFPGVHRPADIELAEDDQRIRWRVEPRSSDSGFDVRVAASIPATPPASPCEPIGGACLAADIGLSPGHAGAGEAARMEPDHRVAQLVEIDHLDSQFLASFVSVRPAPSYLMRDVAVTWSPAPSPSVHTLQGFA